MRVAYIGNFGPATSTENDILDELHRMGVQVLTVQEGDLGELNKLSVEWAAKDKDLDAVLWTSTKQLRDQWGADTQRWMLYQLQLAQITTIGIHLDRWWGLDRQMLVVNDPYFQVDCLFTADGAHARYFGAARCNHQWMAPAIATRHTETKGEFRREYAHDIAFVGNWVAGNYHPEWTHRPELIKWLNRHYRGRVGLYPKRLPNGNFEPRIEGQDKADLYASAKIIIGDSCLVPKVDGTPMTHYVSDRVFETIGRGGFLMHPEVEGVIGSAYDDLLNPGLHCSAWELGNWSQLKERIDSWLDPARDEERRLIAECGRRKVAGFDTYKNRLLDIFQEVGLL